MDMSTKPWAQCHEYKDRYRKMYSSKEYVFGWPQVWLVLYHTLNATVCINHTPSQMYSINVLLWITSKDDEHCYTVRGFSENVLSQKLFTDTSAHLISMACINIMMLRLRIFETISTPLFMWYLCTGSYPCWEVKISMSTVYRHPIRPQL